MQLRAGGESSNLPNVSGLIKSHTCACASMSFSSIAAQSAPTSTGPGLSSLWLTFTYRCSNKPAASCWIVDPGTSVKYNKICPRHPGLGYWQQKATKPLKEPWTEHLPHGHELEMMIVIQMTSLQVYSLGWSTPMMEAGESNDHVYCRASTVSQGSMLPSFQQIQHFHMI